MHKFKIIAGVVVAAVIYTHPARAKEYEYVEYRGGSSTDWAEVVRVEAIRTTVRVATPRRECWQEEVPYRYSGYGGGHSYTPVIIGGIVGGVVGNQFGKGSGNTLATVAGALLGGSVGRDHARYYGAHVRRGGYTTMETRCSVRNEYHEEERIDGYRVDYRYDERVYTTRMDHHPGDRIRVNVSVTPAY
jgi:uncharacterized protein YcfJ